MRPDYPPLRVSDGEYLYEGEFWLTIENIAAELDIIANYASLLSRRWRRIQHDASRTGNGLLYNLSDALHWDRFERRRTGRPDTLLAWHPAYGPPKSMKAHQCG